MKTPGGKGNKTEISNLPDKEFKTLEKRKLTEFGERDEYSENLNKEVKNIKMYQTKLENTIIEMKNIIQGINSRPGDT